MKKKFSGYDLIVVFFLILVALLSIIPFVWSFISSLKTIEYNFQHPLSWIPRPIAFGNYAEVVKKIPFARYTINTLIYAGGKTIIALLLCPLAGHAFARKQFKGKELFFIFVISLMMVPYQVTIIPVFLILKMFPLAGGNNIFGQGGTGLLNTYWGLILPSAVTPLNIFLMRQYFYSIPKSIEEAARIDGASSFRIYWQIALPLAKPALTAVGIFSFQGAWNDFIWPLIVCRTKDMYTLQLGLQVFQDETQSQWPLLMAATILVTLPMLIIFIIFQQYFFKGVSFAGSYR